MFSKVINGYTIKISTRKNKKYDVYKNGKFITSFGDTRYEHFHDKIGYYSKLNHNDKMRRDNYKKRHQHDNINNPNFAGFWSYHYLW